MTLEVKIFENCLSGFIDGTPKYISWPNFVKIGRCEVPERLSGLPHKKLGLRTFCAKWADRPQNFLNVVTLDLSTYSYTEFGPNRLRYAGLIPERLIFRLQK